MSFVLPHDETVQDDNVERLRSEFGWHEVAHGLGRILMGYAILIIGTFVGIALIVGSVILAISPKRKPDDLTHVWIFYIGLGVLSLVGLFAYGTLLAGKLRCLMGSPERNNAKWLMFACMACIVTGPVLNVVTGMTGVSKGPNFKQGAVGFKVVQYTQLGGTMQIASVGLGMGSMVFFLLFLQAIARSFEDTASVSHVNLYLTVVLVLTGASLFLTFGAPHLLFKPPVLIALGGGWAITSLWYLILIAKIRLCIINGMKQIRSPLELEHV